MAALRVFAVAARLGAMPPRRGWAALAIAPCPFARALWSSRMGALALTARRATTRDYSSPSSYGELAVGVAASVGGAVGLNAIRTAYAFLGCVVFVKLVAWMYAPESEAQVVERMCAAFKAGGVQGWDARFSLVDADATVARPAVVADIVAILRPGLKHEYATIMGATGTGKSTAVRQAIRALAAESAAAAAGSGGAGGGGVGVVYFSAPELTEYARGLAVAVDGCAPVHALHRLLRFFGGELAEHAVLREEPRATWAGLSQRLVAAALLYRARHGVAPTLVLDATELVAKHSDAGFLATLQDFAKACADGALLRVVFVCGDGRALPALHASLSAASRMERAYEVGDLSDQDAVAFVRAHFGGARDEAQAQELVATITGGRFSLLRLLGGSTRPLGDIRAELNKVTMTRLALLGMRATHPLFAALLESSSAGIDGSTAVELCRGLPPSALEQLLRVNILAAHPSGTLTFDSRHVARCIQEAAAQRGV